MDSQNDKTLAFFGKITASLTHELKNILAIIQESAGLMEDICALAPVADTRYKDKFTSAMQSIKIQLQRGMELTTRFNRFAHVPDHSRAELDLSDAVTQIRALAERFARLKYIELSIAEAPKAGIPTQTRPIGLYMALFFAIESCLNITPAQGGIVLHPTRRSGKPAVGILCRDDAKNPAPEAFFADLSRTPSWPELTAAMAPLGHIEPDPQHPGFWLVFG